MARTAPAVDGTPTYTRVSFRWIDSTGDKRSDSIITSATNAQIEALADALADASNAVLYEIDVDGIYGAVPQASDAVNDTVRSAYANIVMLAKHPTGDSFRSFIPAPQAELFTVDLSDLATDQPDLTDAKIIAIATALLAVAGTGFEMVSARYSERREINESVKF